MKKLIVFLVLFLSGSIFAQWQFKPGTGTTLTWVKVDTCFFLADSFSDFNDMYFAENVSGENFDTDMIFGNQLQKYNDGEWKMIQDKLINRLGHGSNGYLVVSEIIGNAGRVASLKGNGRFRIRGYASVWNPFRTDTSGWSYTVVKDIIAPDTPDSIKGEWENAHPKITFCQNTEVDLKGYNIYKRVDNGPSVFLAFVTTNYYVDNSETQYSLGNDKKMVYYKVTSEDNTDNESAPTSEIRFVCNNQINKPIVGENGEAKKFRLYQNYPNPFNPTTLISFNLEKREQVKLDVFNMLGQKVASVYSGILSAGEHSFSFDASLLPSGTYIYRISTDDFSAEKKMNLIK